MLLLVRSEISVTTITNFMLMHYVTLTRNGGSCSVWMHVGADY